MKSSISIVIPNYNGLDLLQKHLPSVVKHANGVDIIIIDDASIDKSIDWISTTYPEITIIANKVNLGFARSVNKAFDHSKSELVLLLNSDVSIHEDTISQLAPHFSDSKLFAVGAQEKLIDDNLRGKSTGHFSRGMFMHGSADSTKPGDTMWVFAASGMFRRSIWQQLGGFDSIFYPAYYEDIDICFRAWKSGFTCFYNPKAKVKHDAESTMNQTLGPKKQTIVFRNQIIFTWKHFATPSCLLSHLLWLPYHLTITSQRTNGAFLRGFIQAILTLPKLISKPLPKYIQSSRRVIKHFKLT